MRLGRAGEGRARLSIVTVLYAGPMGIAAGVNVLCDGVNRSQLSVSGASGHGSGCVGVLWVWCGGLNNTGHVFNILTVLLMVYTCTPERKL